MIRQILAESAVCFNTAISEEAGFFIFIKNEPLVGPQQPQIGGIESSFFG